jgi:lantibiotic leader peptide-processing serine protease
MNRRLRVAVAAIAGGLVLASCADVPQDLLVTPTPTAALHSFSPSETGDYVVSIRGNGRSFGSSVAAAGGTIRYLHEGVGLALVSGLSEAGARQLAASRDVAEILADVRLALERPGQPILADLQGIGPASIENPASAIRFSWQWNMMAIGAPAAWAANKLGSPDVTVAILDTGIDYNSLDANGLVDLSRSRSFVPSDDAIIAEHFPGRHPIDDLNGHGTNVASQVSSTALVYAGVTSKTTLIGVKVLGATGGGSFGGVLAGILWAADHDADVLNLSLGAAFTRAGGGGDLVSLLNRVINYANRKGAVIVVTAGNEAADLDRNIYPHPGTGIPTHFPSLQIAFCNSAHVICVSATGPTTPTSDPDQPAFYTNFGRSAVSVAGPGGSVGPPSVWPWSPLGNNNVSWVWSMCPKSFLVDPDNPGDDSPSNRPCASGGVASAAIGTSQAAPHVAGLAALLVAEMGKNRPAQIRARIEQSADDLGPRGVDPYFGRGRINVPKALRL